MQEYSRLVGIDVGIKRIGIAQTDLLKTFSSPVGTYSPEQVFARLEGIVSESKVQAFIVGWPLQPDGSEGDTATMVQSFIDRLSATFPTIPIHKVDERYSSNEAMGLMIDAGLKRKKRKQKESVDRIAAAIILQRYLEENHS
ncbi:MAG: Holliday junction resolvase RuvX [Balneola sp.]|nr:MAG: Holliday junction resolvase RuvX [Balneola sp.]